MYYLRTSVGVDVRGDDLVLSALQSNLSAGVYTSFKRVAAFRTRNRAEVRREIDGFFKTHRLNRETLVLGVPRREVIVRHLDLPAEVADNLKQVVYYQVQSYEPSEDEKFYHDFTVLRGPDGARRLQVLVVMVRKSYLDGLLSDLLELGMRPAAVSVGFAGLSSLLLQPGSGLERKTSILMDVQPSGLEILAVREGALVYSREVPRSEPAGWKSQILEEIRTAAARVRLGPEDSIDRLVLSGEEAEPAQRELKEEIPDCSLFGTQVRFEMPLPLRGHLHESASALGLAWCGLSRRAATRFNLLPPELRFRQSRWAYVPSVILGLAVIGLFLALGFRQLAQERVLIRQLDQEMAALKPRVDRILAIRGEGDRLEKQIAYIEGLVRQRDLNLELLNEITTILPDDTFLNFYQNREGSVQIAGSSNSTPDLIPKLESSPLLRTVTQRGTVFRDAQTGKERFNFEAKLER